MRLNSFLFHSLYSSFEEKNGTNCFSVALAGYGMITVGAGEIIFRGLMFFA